MEVIKKQKQVEYQVYKTADGKEFDLHSEALRHEKMLNQTAKNCDKCGGNGRVNYRTERVWHNTDWIPTKGEYVSETKSDVCIKCNGKGFLELKWT